MVYEPLTDLFHLFSTLTATDGTILIPNVNDKVRALTSQEVSVPPPVSPIHH
jgi:hypothetical protein